VAEEAVKESPAMSSPPSSGSGRNTMLLSVLAVINMIAIGGVGFMLYKGKQKEAAQPKIEDVIQGEHAAQGEEAHEDKLGKPLVVPLETFIVNLAGSKGRRVFKADLELEVSKKDVVDEIEQRRAQVRDIIIVILSGRTYDQVSTKEGKNQLREEIKDTVNAFLAKGKISNVFFTNLLHN
jgi:flagellar protein FliL